VQLTFKEATSLEVSRTIIADIDNSKYNAEDMRTKGNPDVDVNQRHRKLKYEDYTSLDYNNNCDEWSL